jgi:hypothetical protein
MRALSVIIIIGICFCSGIKKPAAKGNVPRVKAFDPHSLIREAESLLQDGDLLVRLNYDPASQFIKNFNRVDKKYSHAGLVFFENDKPYIWHILNDENNISGTIKKESLLQFANPRNNFSFGIFRYALTNEETKNLKTQVLAWHKKGIEFDNEFSLKSNSKMYCSEMIYKAIKKATGNRITPATTELTGHEAKLLSAYLKNPALITAGAEIISIDNLYINHYCKPVKEYSFLPISQASK